MIISHKNKFTLLRVPKTGSTSLEASIRFCGAVDEKDICSFTDDANLPLQNIPKDYKKEGWKNMELINLAHKRKNLGFKLTDEEAIALNNEPRWMLFFEHNTLDDIIKIPSYSKLNLITEKQIYSYKHYGVFREPIERYLSSYIFFCEWSRSNQPITIQGFHKFTLDYLEKNKNILFRPQVDWFYYKGKQIVKPLLFDNWSSEASKMIIELGFKPLAVYPRFKEGGWAKRKFPNGNPKPKDWIDPYPKVKEIIKNRYKEDLDFYSKIKKDEL